MHQRQIIPIIAEICRLLPRETVFRQKFFHRGDFIGHTEERKRHSQFLGTRLDDRRRTPRDDADEIAHLRGPRQSETVPRREDFHRFPVFPEKNPSVRQRPVHIECHQPNRHHTTPCRSKSVTWSIPTARPASSTTGSTVMGCGL